MKITCTKPTVMYSLDGQTTKTGKKKIIMEAPLPGIKNTPIPRRCGSCTGCRIKRRMDLAIRLEHEATQHDQSWFVTATYSPENLPQGGTLVADDMSAFIKRLRRKVEPTKIRFFGIGEYGEQLGRSHYHFIIFGLPLPDKILKYTKQNPFVNYDLQSLLGTPEVFGVPYYQSDLLDESWQSGIIEATEVSEATMQYVAKYHVEKVTGDQAADEYTYHDPLTDQIIELEHPTARMSRNPGLGKKWLEKNYKTIYPEGVIKKGPSIFSPPTYYDKWYEQTHPEEYEALKHRRFLKKNLDNELDTKLNAIELNRKAAMKIGSFQPTTQNAGKKIYGDPENARKFLLDFEMEKRYGSDQMAKINSRT